MELLEECCFYGWKLGILYAAAMAQDKSKIIC